MFGSFLNLFLLILHIGQTGSFPPPLSEKEEKELVEKMLKGDDSARSKLLCVRRRPERPYFDRFDRSDKRR